MVELLLMEPNKTRAAHLLRLLSDAGYRCTLCDHAAEGLALVRQGSRVLTILNTRMPWTESAPLLKLLAGQGLPVLFLTREPANAAHLKALYHADREVLPADAPDASVLDAVERLLTAPSATLTRGDLSLDMDTHRVSIDGRVEKLTDQECLLLQALMLSPDTAVSREDLLRTAWGYQSMGITRTVDVHVQRLRRKVGCDRIETVYRTGYRLRTA